MPPMILDSDSSRSSSSSPDIHYPHSNIYRSRFEYDEEGEEEWSVEDSEEEEDEERDPALSAPLRNIQTSTIYQSIEVSESSEPEDDGTDISMQEPEHPNGNPIGRSRKKVLKQLKPELPKAIRRHRASAYPKSRSDGYTAPSPLFKEEVAVNEMLNEIDKLGGTAGESESPVDGPEFTEFGLTEFTVYLPENKFHSFEIRGLQHLATRSGHGCLLFDGILSAGGIRRYIEAVPFKVCSIGNYDTEFDEVGSNIWIQSDHNAKSDIYYRLGKPSPEYKRHHEGFTWLANLAKHFVDYCMACETPISVHNFRSDFFEWATRIHGSSVAFSDWHRKYGRSDYRRAVAANISFLFKESVGVSKGLRQQPIWGELLERDFVPQQPIVEQQTVVTPFVYECFKDLKFGHHLKVVNPTGLSESRQTQQERSLDLTGHASLNKARMFGGVTKSRSLLDGSGTLKKTLVVEIDSRSSESIENERKHERQRKVRKIKVGDVLSVIKDGDDSLWKDEVSRWKTADDCWYIYVQGIHVSKRGEKSFDALWLYKPSDTCCAKMKYPFANELFLSDNCTCGRDRIKEEEVLDIVPVSWHGDPSKSSHHIVIRQTYLENERFVTLETSHKQCEHLVASNKPILRNSKDPVGSTILARPRHKSNYSLEPYEILRYYMKDNKPYVVLRRLLRRIEVDGCGKPNELVYSDQTYQYPITHIEQRCLVRFYSEDEVQKGSVPAPYNRDGSGNAFYITTSLVVNDGVPCLRPIQDELPKSFIQGFDPVTLPSRKPLRGMDLYCGGGNFGRGLEEGGAVRNEWAVDIDKNAIHTYSANLRGSDDDTKLFFGSVNDMLSQAIQGNPKNSKLIPLPGDVDFISAGSPCQGFSILNSDRNNERGLKNQSLVASVAAYIDFYRPKYGILENVMTMAQKGQGRDEDVLSQLVCAIVGMGYQAQLFVVDAWSCGSPQSRSRLFVSFAAPGFVPLEHPAISHSHPSTVRDRGLGKLANGQAFGRRLHVLTPFNYVTAGEATKDLPNIGDGLTYHCIPQPDHVMGNNVTERLGPQIDAIPVLPRGMNFSKAWNDGKGVMSIEQRSLFTRYTKTGKLPDNQQASSNAWGRVNPNGLFPTIVVTLSATDSRTGCCLHWDEPRYLTTMEARRAQGFPDDEIVVGSSIEGWKLMGNSVARTVSMALGISLQEAWLKNSSDDNASSKLFTASDSLERSTGSVSDAESSCASTNHTPSNKSRHNTLDKIPSERSTVNMGNKSRAISGSRSQDSTVRSTHKHRQDLVVPDSAESSGDEDHLITEMFQSVLNSLPLRAASNRVEQPGFNSISKGDQSRKRLHGALQEPRTPIEKTRKVPKVMGQSSPQSASKISSSSSLASRKRQQSEW